MIDLKLKGSDKKQYNKPIAYKSEIVERFLNEGVDFLISEMNKLKESGRSSYAYDKLFKFFWLMSKGLCQEYARSQSGLSNIIYDWLNVKNKGYLGKEEAAKFSEAIKKAVESFEQFHIRKITAASSWQSSAWMLERSPLTKDKYKQLNRNELTGANSEPLFNPYDKLSKEKKREILTELEKANKNDTN